MDKITTPALYAKRHSIPSDHNNMFSCHCAPVALYIRNLRNSLIHNPHKSLVTTIVHNIHASYWISFCIIDLYLLHSLYCTTSLRRIVDKYR